MIPIRPPASVRTAAKAVLDEHGWTMQDFVVACLIAVNRDPEMMLALLAQFKSPSTRGRPRKNIDPVEHDHPDQDGKP